VGLAGLPPAGVETAVDLCHFGDSNELVVGIVVLSNSGIVNECDVVVCT
jgi:hypothetical protein